MRKVCYIISSIDKAVAFEWIARFASRKDFSLNFIFLISAPSATAKAIEEMGINVKIFSLKNKKSYPLALYRTLMYLRLSKPDVIHTHLRDADLIGLTAARILRIPARITTRHSSTFNHNWHPKAVKWDKFINSSATHIVAISEVVKRVLMNREGVSENKITLIHHGFDLQEFQNVSASRVHDLKLRYKLPKNHIIIGVIARYIEWKGVQYIIPTVQKLIEDGHKVHLVLANADGPFKENISSLLNGLDMNDYTEIQFEADLFALYRAFDIYVHTPIDPEVEAFGQTYVEALASGIPSVFTISGIAHEFLQDRENALIAKFQNSEDLYEKLKELILNEDLREQLRYNGLKSVDRFSMSTFIENLENLYANA